MSSHQTKRSAYMGIVAYPGVLKSVIKTYIIIYKVVRKSRLLFIPGDDTVRKINILFDYEKLFLLIHTHKSEKNIFNKLLIQ